MNLRLLTWLNDMLIFRIKLGWEIWSHFQRKNVLIALLIWLILLFRLEFIFEDPIELFATMLTYHGGRTDWLLLLLDFEDAHPKRLYDSIIVRLLLKAIEQDES